MGKYTVEPEGATKLRVPILRAFGEGWDPRISY
jgi:hypothetical protein